MNLKDNIHPQKVEEVPEEGIAAEQEDLAGREKQKRGKE
jgi:hypothetical protein